MGPLTAEMKAACRRADGRHQVRHRLDDAVGVPDAGSSAAASRRTSPRSSARRRCASTSSGSRTRRRHRRSSTRCARWCASEMEAGALGIGSSLIYAPAFYASTEELIELCKVGGAVSRQVHLAHAQRGQPADRGGRGADPDRREARIPAEIYHLKAAGRANWPKMDQVIGMIEKARAEGLAITADMYTYEAGSTGLDASMPPWVLDGGYDAAYKRLADPATRKKIAQAIRTPSVGLGEPVSRGGLAGARAAGRVQVRRAQAADREDARRGRAAARRGPGRHDHEPGARGPLARRDGLLHDVGGQHPQADRACRGCRSGRTRRRWPRSRRSRNRRRTRAPTATSRGCSASTCATRR